MTDRIPLVYVAGPYRAKTTAEVDSNIYRAREIGKLVARCGAYPIIPHSNTSHFDGLCPNSFWLPATLEVCRRCDAIVLCQNWDVSEGTIGERELMQSLSRPEFYATDPTWTDSLMNWVSDWVMAA